MLFFASYKTSVSKKLSLHVSFLFFSLFVVYINLLDYLIWLVISSCCLMLLAWCSLFDVVASLATSSWCCCSLLVQCCYSFCSSLLAQWCYSFHYSLFIVLVLVCSMLLLLLLLVCSTLLVLVCLMLLLILLLLACSMLLLLVCFMYCSSCCSLLAWCYRCLLARHCCSLLVQRCYCLFVQHCCSLINVTTPFATLQIKNWDNKNYNNRYVKFDFETDLYKMCENRHFETQVKLFIVKFWNYIQVFQGWNKFKNKNWVKFFKTL